MSTWERGHNMPETVYSDYTPVQGGGGGLEGDALSVVAGLQVDDPAFGFDDSSRQPGQSRATPSLVPKVVAAGPNTAPKPPPRLQQAQVQQQVQQASQPKREAAADTRPSAAEIHLVPLSEDPEMSPGQLLHVATQWAKTNGFSNEQLMEFGHLLQMVAATFIPRNQISNLRALDQGSFGQIYSGVYDGSAVAVKQCSSDGSQIQLKMRELLLELSVLVRIRHPNIVTFWGTAANFPAHPQAADKPYIGMVFELCEKGSLYRALHQNGLGHKLDHKKKMRVLLDVGRGMSYIHAKGIIHRDLKPRNIMLSEKTPNNPLCIIDFGSAVTKGSRPFMNDYTEVYAPPEAPLPDSGNPFSYDIYTLGIVGLRVLMPSLIAGENGIATLGKVCVAEIPSYNYDLRAWAQARASDPGGQFEFTALNKECEGLMQQPVLLDLLSRMLSPRVSERPSAEECLRMLGPQWEARLASVKQGQESRGNCGKCGQPVLSTDLGRYRDARGVYFHGTCPP
mmetsp:Transcript_650/g.1643  ORF Transcript_650/g.1643 Transcript_650/m.1643 type:complete len:508 (-) Transcript_650:183-1706(-)